ncbi:MAG: PEP-CTERM sorting domain-containing protein [Phycisphaeraceae bacterium]|nr:PEP-CTERM sorting domain-containing protein [Phycisphaeraceae bacterium]
MARWGTFREYRCAAWIVGVSLLGWGAQAWGSVAYVYQANAADAASFKTFLDGRGYPTTLLDLSTAAATDLASFDVILVADDAGNLNDFGSDAVATAISASGRPVIGIGEGGYSYFGKLALAIGWPNGWHGPANAIIVAILADSLYHTPHEILIPVGGPLGVYNDPLNTVGIDLPNAVAGVNGLAREVGDADHYDIVRQGSAALWGFSGSPDLMTDAGRDMFENLLHAVVPEPSALPLLLVVGLAIVCSRRF